MHLTIEHSVWSEVCSYIVRGLYREFFLSNLKWNGLTWARWIRGHLACLFKTQCSVFKHWTLVSKIWKNVFGHGVQNRIVWKLLLQNPCLNSIFWNVAGADFKQQTDVFDGTSVIKLNSLINFFGLCSDPPDQLFFNLCLLSSLYSHLISPLLSSLCIVRTHVYLTHLSSLLSSLLFRTFAQLFLQK